MITPKNILVATDFGEAAETALRYGRDFARTFGATLHVIHVADNIMARVAAGEVYGDVSGFQREVKEAAEKQLDCLVRNHEPALGVRAIVRMSTSPAVAIASYARDAAIDLIIVGTHGRGALAHLIMGSVAERVVRIAPCPVLVVRQLENAFVRPEALDAAASV
jgi:nucleotide-binding universal stress UspA family protein